MVGIYSSTNNGMDSSSKVSFWNLAKTSNPLKINTESISQNSFAAAIYGDGPNNLFHPACANDVLAQNLDITA